MKSIPQDKEASAPAVNGKLAIEGAIIDVDYLNKGDASYIRLTIKGTDGKAYEIFDRGFKPYFYLVPNRKLEDADVFAVSAMADNNQLIKAQNIERETKKIFGKSVEALKIFTKNPSHVPKLSSALSQYGTCYENDIPFAKRYSVDRDVVPMVNYEINAVKENGMIFLESFGRVISEDVRPNVMCFDIESYNPQGMPRMDRDPIIMISYSVVKGKETKRGVITYRQIDKDFVTVVKDEKAMFKRFAELLDELDVDVIVGYNSANFDVKYLLERSKALRIDFDISRFEGSTRIERHGLVDKVKIGGRAHIDMYLVVKFISVVGAAEHILKLNSYTLKNVYEAITKDSKFAVEKGSIYKMWDGTKEELEDLATYSLADADALQKVYDTFMPIMIETSRVTHNPIGDTSVSTTGQLVEFMLMRYCSHIHDIIPNKPNEYEIRERMANPIEGAYVKTPEPGIYDNLAMFDFRGLYPSIIISYNIDPSTICRDCKEYYESPTGTRFERTPLGITPTILKQLIAQRAEVKKAYKKDPNNIYLGSRSQALKIISNSVYGYLGYARSRWYSRECAGSVTAYGRQYIKEVMSEAEKTGIKIIYGDSVSGDSMIRVKDDRTGICSYNRIESLFTKTEQINDQGKEYQFLNGVSVETLDKNGSPVFKKIRYVMRHKNKKKMYRVWFTNVLYIDVTEDHSLIGLASLSKMPNKAIQNRFVEVKPSHIGKAVNSLIVKKASAESKTESRNYEKEIYELMGFFIGDGSFDYGRYKGKGAKRYYIAITSGNDKEETREKLLNPLKDIGKIRNIIDKGRGDFVVNGLDLVRLFEKEILQEEKKRIPRFMFNESRGNICSFLRGLFSSDGTIIFRSGKPIIRYTTIDGALALQIRQLLWECGIASSVFKENNENKYKGKGSGTYSNHVYVKSNLTFINDIKFLFDRKNRLISNYRETSQVKKNVTYAKFDFSSVKKIEQINHDDYVYDIEVSGLHRFFANGVLVHNTDSLVMLLGGKTKDDATAFMKAYNSKLPESMELELEDFYTRGVFVGKKTDKESAGAKKKYALISESGRIKIRGFELVRRDWSRVARDTQRKVLEIILKEGDKDKAADAVRQVISDLKDGKVPISEVVISTQIRKGIESYDIMSPEIAAAKKAVKAGFKTKDEVEHSVIGYVITKHGSSISDKAQLEGMATDYDADYYINRQVLPATMRILKELNFNEEELKGWGTQKKL